MNDLDRLVEEYFKPKEKEATFNIQSLLEIVEGVMRDVPTPRQTISEDASAQELTLSMIPEIAVSEIGWSDVSTGDTGETIAGPQRKLLQDYLDNIQVTTLSEKLRSLEDFYANGAQELSAAGVDRSKIIQQVISYLVFYKTLTKVITNFNASSAGFSFESFLATLLDGKQIPANTGTIADFVDANGVPISLKLYREKGLVVGGSYTDLVNDLVGPQFSHPLGAAMKYIICTKALEGEGLEQKGSIKFYDFDFTLDNVFNIVANSKGESQRCIHLPRVFIDSVEAGEINDVSQMLPSRQNLPSAEEMESLWISNVKELLKADGEAIDAMLGDEGPLDLQALEKIFKAISYAKSDAYFTPEAKRAPRIERGLDQLSKGALEALIGGFYPSLNQPQRRAISAKILWQANNNITKTLKADVVKQKRDQAINELDFETDMGTLVAFYSGLSEDEKRITLKNTLGYMRRFQFDLNRSQALNEGPPTNTEYLGEIKIGAAEVQVALDKVRDILNTQVFEIFNSLKLVTQNLNAYFAGGLQNDQEANTAIDEAGNIQTKTEEIKDT